MISVVTLRELENIKTASNKDEDTKAKARKIARLLDKHWDMVHISFIKSEDAKNQTNDEQIVYAVKVEQEAAQWGEGKSPSVCDGRPLLQGDCKIGSRADWRAGR